MSSSDSNAITSAENLVFEDVVLDRPCVYCKLLEFNDLQQGGRARVANDGTRYLSFDTERRRNIMREENLWKTNFQLGYQRDDSLPDLPALSRTASRGCAFCDMLRRDIISAWNEKICRDFDLGLTTTSKKPSSYPKIAITEITYQFDREFDIKPQLDMLVVDFSVMGLRRNVQYALVYNFQARSSGKLMHFLILSPVGINEN